MADAGRDTRVIKSELGAQILERAAEIDVSASGVSNVEQLRAAAAEAGISTEAFDRAVAELMDPESEVAEPSVLSIGLRRSPRTDLLAMPLLSGVLVTLVGVLFGALTDLLPRPGEFVWGAGLALFGVFVGILMYKTLLEEREPDEEQDRKALPAQSGEYP